MAIQPKRGRIAAASRPEPAGYSGFPTPPDFPASPVPHTTEARLQRQLDALAAIREQLRAMESEWPGACAPSAGPRPDCGEFLLYPVVCRFRRGLADFAGACAALAAETQARLDRVRPGLETLRGWGRRGRVEVGHGRG